MQKITEISQKWGEMQKITVGEKNHKKILSLTLIMSTGNVTFSSVLSHGENREVLKNAVEQKNCPLSFIRVYLAPQITSHREKLVIKEELGAVLSRIN